MIADNIKQTVRCVFLLNSIAANMAFSFLTSAALSRRLIFRHASAPPGYAEEAQYRSVAVPYR